MLITSSSILSDSGCLTYTLAGLEVNLRAKRWLAMLCLVNTRGTRVVSGAYQAVFGRWRRGCTYNLAHCGNLGRLARGIGLGIGCRGGVSRRRGVWRWSGASGGCGVKVLRWEGKARCCFGRLKAPVRAKALARMGPGHRPSLQRGKRHFNAGRASSHHGCAEDIVIGAFCASTSLPSFPGAPRRYPPCVFDPSAEASSAREARPIQSALTSISPSQQAQVLWRASG